MRRGAGAYICGEESSLLESIEGKRGLPRHKPPYPFQVGLFGLPTLINNVETLFWVRDIVEKGADWWKSHGRNGRHRPAQLLGVGPRQESRREAGAGRRHRARTDRRVLRRHGRRPQLPRLSAGRRVGRHPAGLDGQHPARFRHAGKIRLLHRLGRGRHPVRPGQREGRGAEPDALLRGRELRPVHALPGRHPEGGDPDGAPGLEPRIARRIEPGDARCVDLRARPGGLESADLSDQIFPRRVPRKPRNDEDQVRTRRQAGRGQRRRDHLAGGKTPGPGKSRICAIRRSRTTGPTAIAAPAWWRSRASACWPPPASARRASA